MMVSQHCEILSMKSCGMAFMDGPLRGGGRGGGGGGWLPTAALGMGSGAGGEEESGAFAPSKKYNNLGMFLLRQES